VEQRPSALPRPAADARRRLVPEVLHRHQGRLHALLRDELVALWSRRRNLHSPIIRVGEVLRGAWPELTTDREDREQELPSIRSDRMEADLLVLGILLARADLVTLDTYAGGGRDYLGIEEMHRLANEGRRRDDEGQIEEEITIDRINVALADLRAGGLIEETEHAREADPDRPGRFRAFGNSRRRLSRWIFHRMGKRVWDAYRQLSGFLENRRGKRGWRAIAFRSHRWIGGSQNRKAALRRAALDLAHDKKLDEQLVPTNGFDRPQARPVFAAKGLDRAALEAEFEATGLPGSEYYRWLAERKARRT